MLEGDGQLGAAIRKGAFEGRIEGASPAVATRVDKIGRAAYEVRDEDIEALKRERWSEDQIFELTVSSALGQGLRRLDIVHGLLGRKAT